MSRVILLLILVWLASSAGIAQSSAELARAANPIQQSQITAVAEPEQPRRRALTIPAGTPLDIEAAYTVSSRDMRPGDYLSFRVLVPVKIDGFMVIDSHSLVTARVVKAKRGGHWGKAGKLVWMMQDVVAVDLTRVPLTVHQELPAHQDGITGTSHGGEVAARTIVFGALLFPASPLALMSGFKRGEDAILPQGKRFVVYVQRNTDVRITESPLTVR